MNTINKAQLTAFLNQLQQEDVHFGVFGSEEHRYQLRRPLPIRAIQAFEHQYNITLPEDYRYFLQHIGNGGAGPYYGVLPLKATVEFCDPSRPFPFSPVGTPSKRAVSNWVRDKESGVIAIAHQGCSLNSYLVVKGPSYGTVWNNLDEFRRTGVSFSTWYMSWVRRVTKYALPILQREQVVKHVKVGMSQEEVVGICGGSWKIEQPGERMFLRFQHLETQFELDQNSKVMDVISAIPNIFTK